MVASSSPCASMARARCSTARHSELNWVTLSDRPSGPWRPCTKLIRGCSSWCCGSRWLWSSHPSLSG
eukprot:1514183-Pyramimonas_sp.AAC.1